MANLILVRHGQSQWNLENRFTGWYDAELTEQGKEEAKKSGQLIHQLNINFEQAFTSFQKRAFNTLSIILEEIDQKNLITTKAWQLNERHYGALQGLDKKETGAPLIIFPYIPSQNTQFHQVSVSNHLLYVLYPFNAFYPSQIYLFLIFFCLISSIPKVMHGSTVTQQGMKRSS
jgi:hypothetical protein